MKIDVYKRTKWLATFISVFAVVIVACSACSPVPTSVPVRTTPSVQSVPPLDHIVVITFENKDYTRVIGNPDMPTFNKYAQKYTLLTQFHAVTHPSLPNYLAMIGGSTFDINSNCHDCFVNALSLPDLIEASGRTWKTYQEDMQNPCGLGSQDNASYMQKHNPFVYFNAIRMDKERCVKMVVPFNSLQADIDAGTLPDYIFITPNMCNNAHDCELSTTDAWVNRLLKRLIPALQKDGENYLVVLTWDEGTDKSSCCGLPQSAGGRIAVVLISPLVKRHFQDPTPYSHYSLLKSISNSWGLPYIGHARDDETSLILLPWK